MARSREGNGRHRQPWYPHVCADCGLTASARRGRPGQALYVRTHFDPDGRLCPPLRVGETRLVRTPRNEGQLSLFG